MPSSSISIMPKLALIIVIAIIVLFAGYFGLAFILRQIDKAPSQEIDTQVELSSNDQSLTGAWDTGCLVPDPKSPWAEKHTFNFNSNSGNHERFSGESCGSLVSDIKDNFNYQIPKPGQINISYTSGIGEGMTIYDIYKVSGDSLRLGHGFCNCVSSSTKVGVSEGERLDILNDFLVYKKK